MNIKLSSAYCAGLIAMGIATSASAATINVNFDGSGDSIDYVFNTTSSGLDPFTFDSASFTVNGSVTTYDSSNFDLILGDIGEVSTFEVWDADTAVSIMVFNGFVGFTGVGDDIFEMFHYGDGTSYAEPNYTFDTPVDSPMLYISGGPSPFGDLQMTQVSVSTVVPVPAAIWLFSSGILGLLAVSRKKA